MLQTDPSPKMEFIINTSQSYRKAIGYSWEGCAKFIHQRAPTRERKDDMLATTKDISSNIHGLKLLKL